MTEAKPLEVIVQVERVYNVQEIVTDMKAMGGQVAEYALVVEKLCDIIERQKKEFDALLEDLEIAEAERDEQRERKEEEKRPKYKDKVEMLGGHLLVPRCFGEYLDEGGKQCNHINCEYRMLCRKNYEGMANNKDNVTHDEIKKIRKEVSCFGSYYSFPWFEICEECKYYEKCKSISEKIKDKYTEGNPLEISRYDDCFGKYKGTGNIKCLLCCISDTCRDKTKNKENNKNE